ncbi:MAG: lysylphosphatidylglycerol synthase transmembrane domain-containing protein [Anaerolineae bacterium]
MKGWRGLLLGLIVTVASLWLALRGNDLSKVGDSFAQGRYIYLIPGAFFIYLGLVLRAFRWRALLNDRLTTMHSFAIMNVGYMLNTILPLRLGEVARSFLTTRLTPPISMSTSLSSVVVERLTDLLAVVVLIALAIVIAPASAAVPPEISRAAVITGVIGILGMGVLGILAARRTLAHSILNFGLRLLPILERLHLRGFVDRVLDGAAALGSLRGAVAVFVWWGVSWATSILAAYFLMAIFFEQPTWYASLLSIAVASFAVALPALPGNVGPFEAAILVGMAAGGFNQDQFGEQSLAYAIVLHILNAFSYVSCGWFGLHYEKITLGELIQRTRQMASRERPKSEEQINQPEAESASS